MKIEGHGDEKSEIKRGKSGTRRPKKGEDKTRPGEGKMRQKDTGQDRKSWTI